MNNLRITIIAILAIITFWQSPSYAQCKDFNDNVAMPLLYDNENDEQYMLSGRYNTMQLSEGDDMLVFKSLSKGIKYRFIVVGDESLPKDINLTIESWDGDVIYDNKNDNFAHAWNFENKKAQRVKIYINIPKSEQGAGSGCGCLSFITGLLSE